MFALPGCGGQYFLPSSLNLKSAIKLTSGLTCENASWIEYLIRETDLQSGQNLFCCGGRSFQIKRAGREKLMLFACFPSLGC